MPHAEADDGAEVSDTLVDRANINKDDCVSAIWKVADLAARKIEED